MRVVTLLAALLAASLAHAERRTDGVEGALVAARQAFDGERYEQAAELLRQALERDPDCARCAHLLGQAYGRMAERASWLDALGLAEKTRLALERAVRIDPNNVSALEDLIEYYRTAPAFLGGSDRKARALERRVRDLTG